MARVVAVDPEAPDPAVVAEAAAVLERGGLVAFPTETVYGLGARGLHREDVARIFVAKGRPAGHPLILHVDGEAMARSLGRWSAAASRFAGELWPGPLTLIVPRADVVPHEVTGGMETVGLRAPSHPVALALIRALGEPIAAPSANAHMHVSPTTAQHVVSSLGDAVDLVLDGGPCAHGIESTVLALDVAPPRVLRPGATTLARLRAIDPAVQYSPLVIAGPHDARASPGMASKHYSPRARVVIASVAELSSAIAGAGQARVAAIVVSEAGRRAAAAADPCMVLPETAEGYGRELYAALHRVDEARAVVVVVEDVPTTDPAWWAVTDRLLRARQSFTTREIEPKACVAGAAMGHRVVTPSFFPRPRGYANGIVSQGRHLYIAGQIAWDKDARIVSPDFATQFLQALDNVIAVVREAGGATEHIVKLLAFVTDLDAYRAATTAIGEGWRARMGKYYPAMSLVKVAGLLEPGALVEIEGVAVLPS